LTPSLSGSVRLFRWSHGSSIIVASIRSQKMAPPASNRLLRLKTSSCTWRPALALGGELALALGRRSFAWKQADNSLVSRQCQFFFAHRKIPLRLSTIRKLKPQIDLSLPKSRFEPYRKAAELLAGFLPIEPTEGHVTARKRTLAVGACLEKQSLRREADNPPITAPRDLAHRQTRGSSALGCPQQRSHPDTRAASDRLGWLSAN